MEYLRIIPNDTDNGNSVWKLYEESFPVGGTAKEG